MGKASQKKVARAATTGGGRTPGTSQSFSWYVTLAVVLLLGVFLVAFSRNQELNRGQAAAAPKSTQPVLNSDQWHATLGVYICDHYAPNVPLFESRDGIDTLGDGVLDIRPMTPQASGNNANLGFFVKAVSDSGHGKFKLSSSELQYIAVPDDPHAAQDTHDWHNGDKCPNGQSGKVKFSVNGQAQKGNPSNFKLADNDEIEVAFLPSSQQIPTNTNAHQALATTPTATTTTTAPPTTTTTAPPSTTTTTAPKTTSTTR